MKNGPLARANPERNVRERRRPCRCSPIDGPDRGGQTPLPSPCPRARICSRPDSCSIRHSSFQRQAPACHEMATGAPAMRHHPYRACRRTAGTEPGLQTRADPSPSASMRASGTAVALTSGCECGERICSFRTIAAVAAASRLISDLESMCVSKRHACGVEMVPARVAVHDLRACVPGLPGNRTNCAARTDAEASGERTKEPSALVGSATPPFG